MSRWRVSTGAANETRSGLVRWLAYGRWQRCLRLGLATMTYRSASARARVFDDALREAMRAGVPDAIQPENPSAADPAAGTAGTEGVAPETVAAVTAVRDPGSAPSDRDRVQHSFTLKAECPYCQDLTPDEWLGICDCFAVEPLEALDQDRRARLRRWQAVGERRT